MLILGFHGGRKRDDEDNRAGFAFHDGAAVLIKDGEVLAAIEEERLNRVKHSNHFPARSIRYCLDQHKLELRDVDFLATNFEESVVDVWAKIGFLEDASVTTRPQGRTLIASLFAREFGQDISDKLYFCKHHKAHAWSAFGPSGYDESLVLVLDGEGDNRSGMVLLGEGSTLTLLREYSIAQSLGELYTQIIRLLGYNRFDEYKVMGLAPYGDPRKYGPLFEQCYDLLPEGNYALESMLTWFITFEEAGLLAQARRKGEPFRQVDKDIAAALQATLENIVLHVLTYYRKASGQKNLCLAGGVAHNCTMNGKLLSSGLFDNLFVQPAAHDAGGAWGAALNVWNEQRPGSTRCKLRHLYFGTDVGTDDDIRQALSGWDAFLSYERVDHIAEAAARLIADGSVIAWVQGRSEFGPRALGNRSILADPRPASNKSLINQMVKKREGYRPFAPAVLEENLDDYFEVPRANADLSFMIFILKVRQEMRAELGAITHVDGTARVQTVSRQTNPMFWEVIREFAKLTGIAMVLNTSLNNNVEPIVDSAEEAIACFLTTGIDYLVIGNYLISKRSPQPPAEAYKSLALSLPPFQTLVQRKRWVAHDKLETVYALESTVNRLFRRPTIPVSEDTFALLQVAGETLSIAELMERVAISGSQREAQVIREIAELWSARAVILRPR